MTVPEVAPVVVGVDEADTARKALLSEATDAALLVLGRRGARPARRARARSIATTISMRARCPVVVIRRPSPGPEALGLPPGIVVGIDEAGTCLPAVGFAFAAARQRGIGLTALHAVHSDEHVTASGWAQARRSIDRAVQGCETEYPDVPVTAMLVRDDPAGRLVVASAGAALVALGSPPRKHGLQGPHGSTSRFVLQQARGPIALVNPAGDYPGSPSAHPRTDSPATSRAPDEQTRRRST